MLFQDVVIILPFSNFFKISSKRLKVHSYSKPRRHFMAVLLIKFCQYIEKENIQYYDQFDFVLT